MTDTAVQDVTWNLEDLVDGGGVATCEALLAEADDRAAGVAGAALGELEAVDAVAAEVAGDEGALPVIREVGFVDDL